MTDQEVFDGVWDWHINKGEKRGLLYLGESLVLDRLREMRDEYDPGEHGIFLYYIEEGMLKLARHYGLKVPPVPEGGLRDG